MKGKTFIGYDVLRDCSLLQKEKTFRNLYEIICAHGDVPAAMWLEDESVKTLSFAQLKHLTDNFAAVLRRVFPEGRRVCISMDSRKEWFPVFWGLVRSGHDILTVDASATNQRLVSLMSQCSCTDIVCDRPRQLPEGYGQMTLADFDGIPDVSDYEPVWGHDIALCTSGTTSDSRVFVYDEETICYLALFSAKVHDENRLLIDDVPFRALAFLPFHHILGFAAIFIWCHFLGDTMVYLKDRSPITISRTVRKCEVNQIVAVPLLANSITRTLKTKVEGLGILERGIFKAGVSLSLAVQHLAPRKGLKFAQTLFRGTRDKVFGNSIKSIVLGGSHTDPESLKILNAIGYYTITGYGMTETAITGFETSHRLDNRLKGSIGAPMDYTEYRIKPAANSKNSNVGELQIRGRGLHDGRFVDGKKLSPDLDADGWFSSGDIVRINEPLKQYFIEGRIKEVIINESGENVYPDELEDTFSGIEGVSQYTILGLKRGSSRYEDIALVMSLGEGIADKDVVARVAAAVRSLNANLPVYKKVTRAFATGDKLPVANGFKVKRLTLKKLIDEGGMNIVPLDLSSKSDSAAAVAAPKKSPEENSHTNEILMMVRGIYSQELGIPAERIDPNANFIEDLGGDSLQVLSIVTKSEETFGIMIPTESYPRCATINGAVELLNELIYGNGTSVKPQLTVRQPVTSFTDTEEYKHFKQRQEALLASGHNPYFVCHESPLRDTSVVDGRVILDFGSYNYVGMSGRKEVSDAAKAAIDKYGTSASGSRLLAGEKMVHRELEKAIAEWKHAESALVCVGGHSTNVTFVGNFCGKNDLILYDALAHNSIEQGCRLSEAVARPFPHNNLAVLEQILKAQRKYFEKVLIAIEGAYSMDGDVSDVPGFVALKKKYGCFLMVDEAHSACVLGPTGGGVDEYFGLQPDDIDIKYGTLSKGLGTCGGYLAGRKELIEYLRYNLPGFVFSVGMSPALAAASLEAVRLLRCEPSIMERLHANIDCFVSEAKARHLDIGVAGRTAIIPIIVGSDENAVALSNELGDRGISVPPAVYPAVPKNKARLRFDVCSEHTKEQIILALDTLVQAAKDLSIEIPYRDYES